RTSCCAWSLASIPARRASPILPAPMIAIMKSPFSRARSSGAAHPSPPRRTPGGAVAVAAAGGAHRARPLPSTLWGTAHPCARSVPARGHTGTRRRSLAAVALLLVDGAGLVDGEVARRPCPATAQQGDALAPSSGVRGLLGGGREVQAREGQCFGELAHARLT